MTEVISVEKMRVEARKQSNRAALCSIPFIILIVLCGVFMRGFTELAFVFLFIFSSAFALFFLGIALGYAGMLEYTKRHVKEMEDE